MSTKLDELKRQKQNLDAQARLLDEKIVEEDRQNSIQQQLAMGYYKPIKRGIVVQHIWLLSRRYFDEFSDRHTWYSAIDALGSPDFKKDTKMVLVKIESGELIWVTEQTHGNYFGVEENETGVEENSVYIKVIENLT